MAKNEKDAMWELLMMQRSQLQQQLDAIVPPKRLSPQTSPCFKPPLRPVAAEKHPRPLDPCPSES